ncbi:MAG TPA: hypothetical protein VJT72_01180 [Pseudonocardiaceae bacterium]|nr:hypothetical protein [Pseudonocardiaceae bacterium]
MPDARAAAIQEVRQRQQTYQADPWSARPILLPPCEVKILIVTDGFASFGVNDFGMRALLGILAVPPHPWVRFEVTKAHRRLDPVAHIPEFRFDTVDLSGYDQIWLFGVERAGTEISETELRAIAQFMDGGGGVFATGDHEDLGVAMCGRIPRVRNMRKWYWPQPGPNGEPVAPKIDGPDRNDTLSIGNDPRVQLDDQSDDIPQRITPRLYSSGPWNPYFHRSYPHPLLCGPRGIIRVLPDHPHEGECYEPTDLSASFTFDGYHTTEYPAGAAPEVIAWSTIHGGRTSSDFKGFLNPHRYGAIGTYDGHRAGVGRVSVDATWHHFFDVNLIGELGEPDPIKGVGFNATPAGHAVYEEIKVYFRNIGVWLAREDTQKRMWQGALWWARWHHVLAMDVRPTYLSDMTTLDLGELLRIGREARDVLGRATSQCTVHWWVVQHLLRPRCPQVCAELGSALDPWQPSAVSSLERSQDPQLDESQPDIVTGTQAEMLLDALLGAAIYGVASQFPTPDTEARTRADNTDLTDVIAEHLSHSCDVFATYAQQQADKLGALPALLHREANEER